VALLFNGDGHKGRLFSVMRHPIDRVVSIFHYLQQATWEPTYNPEYAKWTIDDYVQSEFCESNWMVRALTNKMVGPLASEDVMIAKEILKRKCLIGLMDRMEESIVRFHAYFGFGDAGDLDCAVRNYANGGDLANHHSHPRLDPNGETWKVLERKNGLDIQLYEYAKQLFEEQGMWMKSQNIL